MRARRLLGAVAWAIIWLFLIIPLFALALLARFLNKPVDVGLGPHPLINNVYHNRALKRYNYTSETFVTSTYFITSEFDHVWTHISRIMRGFSRIFLFVFCIFRYKCLYFYFTGGSFGQAWPLWRFEAQLLKLAGIRIVVMPYGADVQDMALSPNLNFKHTYAQQYRPVLLRRKEVSERVDYWSRNADHIISGCEWVDYMHVWDTLMLAHFSIDTEQWTPTRPPRTSGPLKVLHAPNHRHLKGTQYIVDAVDALRADGLDIELLLVEGVSNDEIHARMTEADIIADQLIIGWYAMFALEGMAMGKPVLCYLREDLKELYITAGLVEPDEIPIVDCRPGTVKAAIERLYRNRDELDDIGRRSRAFVERHHSLDAVGAVFDRINRSIGVPPSAAPGDGPATSGRSGGGRPA